MDEIEFVDVDHVWRTLDRAGRYQMTQYLLLMIAGIPSAFHILSVVFIGQEIEHRCNKPSPDSSLWKDAAFNESFSTRSCSIAYSSNTTSQIFQESCPNGYNYSQPKDRSFRSEWDLVCDLEPLGSLSQTLVMAGMMFGASLLPHLGDKYGRKKLHVTMQFIMFVAGLAMAFNTNFYGFLFLRFILGMCQQGLLIPMSIMALELFPARQREVVGFSVTIVWALSIIIITFIAFVLRNYSWRSLQIALASISAFSIVEFMFLDESLRWLVANKRSSEVLGIIKKAAKINKKDFAKVWEAIRDRSEARRLLHIFQVLEMAEHEHLPSTAVIYEGNPPIYRPPVTSNYHPVSKPKREFGYLDIFKDSTLRPTALVLCCIWMTNSLTYYGLTLLSSKLGGNMYVNFLLGGVLEIPSDLLMLVLLKKIGRKKTCITYHLIAGLGLLAAVLVSALAGHRPAGSICLTVFSLIGRFGISASFNAIWIYTPELFPTNMRNLGLGMASSSARIAGMASPFFQSLANVAIWSPGAIFSGLCILVCVMIAFLPETTGRELPETVEELRALHRTGRRRRPPRPRR